MKIKTGSKNSKIGTPKIEKITKPIAEKREKTPKVQKTQIDSIPTWVRESSEKKPKRVEGVESKLQWRKETKKSQRSFSKNKERDYTETNSKKESAPSDARGGFRNTFDKSATYEGESRKSSWDLNSKKSGTGFEKSKTGYKGAGSTWDKSAAPRVSTRTWDDSGDKPARSINALKSVYSKSTSTNSDSTKTTPTKTAKEEYKKPKYIAPKPTWEKEAEIIDKKKLIDPTK